MEFKFNFNVDDEPSHETMKNVSNSEKEKREGCQDVNPSRDSVAKYFSVADIVKRWSVKDSCDIFSTDEVTISHRSPSIFTITPSDPDKNSQVVPSDLLSSVYEGGLKVWECTMDLIEYMQEEAPSLMTEKSVIDIGCGVGLLGVYAMKCCGASRVTFQDFNDYVILDATGPTALANYKLEYCTDVPHGGTQDRQDVKNCDREIEASANLEKSLKSPHFVEEASSKMDFVAGDWSILSQSQSCDIGHRQYDVILSSETIYNEANFEALHDYLKTVAKPDSIIYMSAKSHYFGVGGSVCGWIEFVKCRGVFNVDVVKTISTNLQRHVLRLVQK